MVAIVLDGFVCQFIPQQKRETVFLIKCVVDWSLEREKEREKREREREIEKLRKKERDRQITEIDT